MDIRDAVQFSISLSSLLVSSSNRGNNDLWVRFCREDDSERPGAKKSAVQQMYYKPSSHERHETHAILEAPMRPRRRASGLFADSTGRNERQFRCAHCAKEIMKKGGTVISGRKAYMKYRLRLEMSRK